MARVAGPASISVAILTGMKVAEVVNKDNCPAPILPNRIACRIMPTPLMAITVKTIHSR